MKPYLKAAFAFLIAFLGALSAALTYDDGLSLGAWIAAALAGVIAAGGVYQIPYAPALVKPKPPKPPGPAA